MKAKLQADPNNNATISVSKATPKAVREILKIRFRDESDQPYWLGSNERLIIDIADTELRELTTDKWILHGRIENTETLKTVRASQVELDGRTLRVVSMSAGRLVDFVMDKISELVERLEPDWDEDLVTLMFAAWCDAESMGVLIDAGLERGAFKPIKTGIGKRADTRTLEEKERDYRNDLETKAKHWSRPYIERLFRDHWSVQPWAAPARYFTSTVRIDANNPYVVPRDMRVKAVHMFTPGGTALGGAVSANAVTISRRPAAPGEWAKASNTIEAGDIIRANPNALALGGVIQVELEIL